MKYIKQLALLIGILMICQINTFAKTQKISKQKTTTTLKQSLKGFEADYLTNKAFKEKVKNKKIWGIVEFVVDLVAGWIHGGSFGKYDEDTKNGEGPYFIFDRNPEGISLNQQLLAWNSKFNI